MDHGFHAMQLDAPGAPLHRVERAMPAPADGEIRIAITACGVCRTDLHIADGDISGWLPIVPGHEIVGRVDALGAGVTRFGLGDRVGVPWLGRSCGTCPYCAAGHENLCDAPEFTGFTRDGGFASHVVADARFCLAIPAAFDDLHAAPLLCAGLIGYRAYRMADGAKALGLYGFGAAAHILAQLAIADGTDVYAFTREGDTSGQDFARRLGCVWAGASTEAPPDPLDAAILFAPVGALVPEALRHVRKGGRVICAGIHMSDIPSFPYADLWEERSIRSVANLTRADGAAFLEAAARCGVRTHVTALPLADANRALDRLRAGEVEGALVLVPEGAVWGESLMARPHQRRESGEGQIGLSGETAMDRFERDPASAARPPECPDCDPPAQPDKAYPETPAPDPDRQPLRTSPEAPVLPDSHPEATPREYPE